MIHRIAKFLAQSVSVLLHPLLVTSILFIQLVLFYPILLSPFNTENAGILIIFILLTTFIIPCIFIGILYYSKIISSLEIDKSRDRLIVILITMLLYTFCTYMLYEKFRMNQEILLIMAGIIACMFISASVSIFWKISIHSTAMAGMVFFMAYLAIHFDIKEMLYPTLIAIILCGSVMSARLFLNKHTPLQIMGGSLLGFVISMALISVLSR